MLNKRQSKPIFIKLRTYAPHGRSSTGRGHRHRIHHLKYRIHHIKFKEMYSHLDRCHCPGVDLSAHCHCCSVNTSDFSEISLEITCMAGGFACNYIINTDLIDQPQRQLHGWACNSSNFSEKSMKNGEINIKSHRVRTLHAFYRLNE